MRLVDFVHVCESHHESNFLYGFTLSSFNNLQSYYATTTLSPEPTKKWSKFKFVSFLHLFYLDTIYENTFQHKPIPIA